MTPQGSNNSDGKLTERLRAEAARTIGEIHAQLQYYDYLLPGDFVPDPPLQKRWFRWRPAFAVTQEMLVWAGTIARARSLMDLKSAEDAVAALSLTRSPEGGEA